MRWRPQGPAGGSQHTRGDRTNIQITRKRIGEGWGDPKGPWGATTNHSHAKPKPTHAKTKTQTAPNETLSKPHHTKTTPNLTNQANPTTPNQHQKPNQPTKQQPKPKHCKNQKRTKPKQSKTEPNQTKTEPNHMTHPLTTATCATTDRCRDAPRSSLPPGSNRSPNKTNQTKPTFPRQVGRRPEVPRNPRFCKT